MMDGTVEEFPYLVVDSTVAKERLQKRKHAILSTIPKVYKPVFYKWQTFVESINKPYIQVEMAEIGIMFESIAAFGDMLFRAIQSIEYLTIDTCNELFFEFVGIKIKKGLISNKIVEPENEQSIISHLCGYSWHKEVPWE
jgi:hypothetical protein